MKRFNRLYLIIVILIMPLCGLPQPTRAAENMTLIQGWNPWAPFAFQYPQGSMAGIDIEIVHHILSHAGYTITYQEAAWARQLKLIEDGTLHITASAMITPEREAYACFSDPYYRESYLIFVRKGEAANHHISSLQDIAGSSFRLGVMRGSMYGDEFVRLMENPEFSRQIETVTSDEQNHQKLLTHRLDGFIQEASRMLTDGKKSGIRDQVEPLFVVGEDDLHFMFSRQSVPAEIIHKFNEGLRNLRADGTYQRIFETYGLDQLTIHQPGINAATIRCPVQKGA